MAAMNARAPVFTPNIKHAESASNSKPGSKWVEMTWKASLKTIKEQHHRSPLLISDEHAFHKQPNVIYHPLYRAGHFCLHDLDGRTPLAEYGNEFINARPITKENLEEFACARELRLILECSGAFKTADTHTKTPVTQIKTVDMHNKRCDSRNAGVERTAPVYFSWRPIPCGPY